MSRSVKPEQVYRHFKGRYYVVLSVAKHTEIEEHLVVYRRLGVQDDTVWCRPLDRFLETLPGSMVERFALVEDRSIKELCCAGLV